jgi:hypothetical protein
MVRILSLLVLLSLALAPLSAFDTAAAANALQVSVSPGFGGIVRPGNWAPVDVSIANAGPSVTGNVDITVERRPGTQNGTLTVAPVIYSVPVSVPEHTTKRFSTAVYVPPLFDQLQVRLTSGTQTLDQQSVTLARVDPIQVNCGVLASDSSAFDSLNGLTIGDSGRQPHVVSIELPDLPANPQLLSSLDCLIVSDYATRGMTPAQQSALTAWVESGGILAVGTGSAGASTTAGFPNGLLPATVNGTVALRSLASLENYAGVPSQETGPWLMANLKVTDGAVVAADESQPVLVVGRRGHGAVFLWALSLTDKPLRGWNGMESIWSNVLSYVPGATSSYSAYYRPEFGWGRAPRETLISGGVVAGPEAQQLLLALLLFGILAGPVNLLVLSRLGRRELALVSVPVLAIGTTVATLSFANAHRQGDVVVNQVSILHSWDGSGVGDLHSFVGVFALHAQTYQLDLPTDGLLTSSGLGITGFGTASGSLGNNNNRFPPTMRVMASGSPQVQGLDLQPGALTSFTIDSHTADLGRVQSALTMTGDQVHGQIVNGLASTIRDAAVVAGTSVQPIGDLRPGGSQNVSLTLGADDGPGSNLGSAVIDRLFPGLNQASAPSRDPKYQILTAALNPGLTASGQVDLGGLSLIGWLDGPLDAVRDPETGQDAHQRILIVTGLNLQLAAAPQVIPGNLLDREQLASSYNARVDSSGITLSAGDTAAFQYTAPVDPSHFAIRSLSLVTAATQPMPGDFEVFNWRTQSWDAVQWLVGNLTIPSPEQYFSATGVVRLRFHYKPLANLGSSNATFTRFQLSVGGVGR